MKIQTSCLVYTVVPLLTLFGPMSWRSKASAQDELVNFTVDVPLFCSFSETAPGTLVSNSNGLELTSLPADGGTAATTRLRCNSNVNVQVGPPTDNGSTFNLGPLIYDVGSFVQTTAGTVSYLNGTTNTQNISVDSTTLIVDQTLPVNMRLRTTSLLPAGIYNYLVNVTAAPY